MQEAFNNVALYSLESAVILEGESVTCCRIRVQRICGHRYLGEQIVI